MSLQPVLALNLPGLLPFVNARFNNNYLNISNSVHYNTYYIIFHVQLANCNLKNLMKQQLFIWWMVVIVNTLREVLVKVKKWRSLSIIFRSESNFILVIIVKRRIWEEELELQEQEVPKEFQLLLWKWFLFEKNSSIKSWTVPKVVKLIPF